MDVVSHQKTKQIHPMVLQDIELDVAITLLNVADDLETGVIASERFNMSSWGYPFYGDERDEVFEHRCGTTQCIGGWVGFYLNKPVSHCFPMVEEANGNKRFKSPKIGHLLSGSHPSDRKQAAKAIRAYVYNYEEYSNFCW